MILFVKDVIIYEIERRKYLEKKFFFVKVKRLALLAEHLEGYKSIKITEL